MLSPVELLPTREDLAALNVLAFLSTLPNPADVNLLVLPPTICQAFPKNHSTVSVFMVCGLMLSGVMLHVNHRGGGDGGGSGCNAIPPKPLERDFLFPPLFFGLPTLRGDALFGALFLLEQKEAPSPP